MPTPETTEQSAAPSPQVASVHGMASTGRRAIEVGFPIVEINRLAVPERNSFKPIYQMHKWFARRASCVFRTILLGTLKPAVQPDGTPTDLMVEFYKDHSNDPDTKDKVILDPFMGGGTTVVEGVRLGCRVTGIDLNPVAWFIVKTAEPPKSGKRGSRQTAVPCPHCLKTVRLQVPSGTKQRKSVQLTVLLCPACEAVWQWRGPVPDGEVECPSCRHIYDPQKGNVPEKGKFRCSCGQQDDIIASIRTLPQDQRLPVRPYALQAYLSCERSEEDIESDQTSLLQEQPVSRQEQTQVTLSPNLLIPPNGKFFTRFTVSDMRRLQQAEALWEAQKARLPYPTSTIPVGYNTNQMLKHNYRYWSDMFASRQLLALSTLLNGIMAEQHESLRDMLLSAFFSTLEGSNLFARFKQNQDRSETSKGVFARHDFQPKLTPVEDNVWGAAVGKGFRAWFEIIMEGKEFALHPSDNYYHTTSQGQKLERLQDGSSAIADVSTERVVGESRVLLLCDSLLNLNSSIKCDNVITDPPYVGNVNYSELADFFHVWLRLALKDRHPAFAPEYTPKAEEIIENSARGKTRHEFFDGLRRAFEKIIFQLEPNGLLVFTFHHTDKEGLVWEGLLEALCVAGFELVAVYPIHGESESSLHLQDKENISYDLIHVCRKRCEDPRQRSWAGIRQEIRRKAREELQAIQLGRYGNQPLPEPDVRLVCIGKCLELYSTHYGHVLDHEGKPLALHKALQDISAIIDQLVTRDRPWPSELESVDAISYVWLKVLAGKRREITVDEVSKAVRGIPVTAEDLKDAGLLVRGRTGRGRTYEVKQPAERLPDLLLQYRPGQSFRETQGELFTEEGEAVVYDILIVDLLHIVIGLAAAGESVVPWLERFAGLRPQLKAALRFVKDLRPDWKDPTDKVLALLEGTPLLRAME